MTEASKHSKLREFGEWKRAIRAYQACISFSDTQVGRLLDQLEQSPYTDNTIIVLWSDHGYHLGEKDHWHKRTLWERSTRIPFIVVAPGIAKPGTRCDRPVNLVDLYPTLLELAGLPEYEPKWGIHFTQVPPTCSVFVHGGLSPHACRVSGQVWHGCCV
ncbi:MAG: sulfatase-like hydrolase/transferase, partial [Planctomycetota bacterium]